MTDSYYDKDGRRQWRTYCDSCHALFGDTAPMKDNLPRENQISEICPVCKGKIFNPDAPKWNPSIR
ncbi:hypothetical protein FACS189476_06110 [Spirochaetia bacterium]|nr:hypothetical protein FACS189476_06110 [Spirochaetia bacterium]